MEGGKRIMWHGIRCSSQQTFSFVISGTKQMLLKPLTAPLHCSAESLQPDSDSAHSAKQSITWSSTPEPLLHLSQTPLTFYLFVQLCHFSLTSELTWLPGSAWWLGEDESLENRDVDLGPVYTLPKNQKALSLTHTRSRYLSSTEEVV